MLVLSPRTAVVRNLAVAVVNGAITLIILLIAPLGLMAVVINTLLITAASYATATASDRILLYLVGDPHSPQSLRAPTSELEHRPPDDLERR